VNVAILPVLQPNEPIVERRGLLVIDVASSSTVSHEK